MAWMVGPVHKGGSSYLVPANRCHEGFQSSVTGLPGFCLISRRSGKSGLLCINSKILNVVNQFKFEHCVSDPTQGKHTTSAH